MSKRVTPRNPDPRSRRRPAEVRARALERLHELPSHDGVNAGVSASIGVGQWQAPMGTDELLEACDLALLRSKREGKGRVTRASEPVA